MQPNGVVTLNVDLNEGQQQPTVKAFIVGNVAVHKCRRGDTFGAGDSWDLTWIPTGESLNLILSIKRRKDAMRVAALFDRCSTGKEIDMKRASRLYRRFERWWRFDQK